MRCSLYRQGKFRLLFIDIHHIIADAASLNILIDDYRKIYFGEALPPLEYRYVDYTSSLHNSEERSRSQRLFWQKTLAGRLPRVDLPLKQSRDTANVRKVAYIEMILEGQPYLNIKDAARACGVSDYMLFLSAYYVLLSRLSGNEEIIIGTEALGRTNPLLKDIVGTFVNVLPLRLQLDPAARYEDFLQTIKTMVLEAFENQDFQFDEMVSLAEKDDEPGRNPIFDFYFSYTDAEYDEAFDELEFAPVEIRKLIKGEYEFTVRIAGGKNKASLCFIYSTDLYDEETIRVMMHYYQNILRSAADDQRVLIEDIDMEQALQQVP
jgi:hypothetical protein